MNALLTDHSGSIADIIGYCENELFIKRDHKKSIGFVRINNH